jgi:hypothetical protein
MYQHPTTRTIVRRLGVAACVGGLVTLLGVGATANALGSNPTEHGPLDLQGVYPTEDTPPGDIEFLDPFEDDSDDPIYDGPLVTLPEGGPIYDGPIVGPLLPEDDGPIFDGPIGPLLPESPQDTTPPVDPPADPPTDPPAQTPQQAPADPPAQDAAPTDVVLLLPYVEITSATVDCNGMVQLSYETGANPQPAAENEHLVMISPASNPAAMSSHRLLQRPVNGTFNVAVQAPTVEAYRVFVVADFEPANLEGVALLDEADATVAAECPAS